MRRTSRNFSRIRMNGTQHMHWQYGWHDGNAIERKQCYWAAVRAEGILLGICIKLKHINFTEHW